MSSLYMRGASSNLLSLTTPLLAGLALVSSILALSTHHWLHTAEKMKNHNRTIVFGPHSQPEFFTKRTYSGLWVVCISQVGEVNYSCSFVGYFPAEPYRPDDQDSTTAIPYTARKSAGYFLLSFSFMFAGLICCLSTVVKKSKKIFSFFSGVSYVVGGLITLVGMINYISIFKAEVGNKLYSRSLLADPVFTYRYGYSFAILILSFLLSEFTVDDLKEDPANCKIIATLSNGTIKTLCDVKESSSTSFPSCPSFPSSVSDMTNPKLDTVSPSSPLRLGKPDLSCSYVTYQQNPCIGQLNHPCYNPLVFVQRQNTLSSSETTGLSSSVCSPNYSQATSWQPSVQTGGLCHYANILSDILLHRNKLDRNGNFCQAPSDTSQERRKKVRRHISIDETPITHTYQQNSLETSSQSSHSPSEESSGGSGSQYSSNYSSAERQPSLVTGERKVNGKLCSTLPSAGSSGANLKSSLSRRSDLKKSFNYKFETDSNLQQIVKQKRENCLQNGLSLSRESLADVFDDESAVSQV